MPSEQAPSKLSKKSFKLDHQNSSYRANSLVHTPTHSRTHTHTHAHTHPPTPTLTLVIGLEGLVRTKRTHTVREFLTGSGRERNMKGSKVREGLVHLGQISVDLNCAWNNLTITDWLRCKYLYQVSLAMSWDHMTIT